MSERPDVISFSGGLTWEGQRIFDPAPVVWSRADAEACHETDRMGADSPYMVDKLQRVLSLGLLGEAFSRAGLWARQWVVGRYAVAVVRLDPEVMGSVRKIRAEVEGARDDKRD